MKQWCIEALMLLTLMTVEARAKQDAVAADRLSVVTTVFPAYDFTREIAGSTVSVSILLQGWRVIRLSQPRRISLGCRTALSSFLELMDQNVIKLREAWL